MGLADKKAACRSEEVNKLHYHSRLIQLLANGGVPSLQALRNKIAGDSRDALHRGSYYGLPIISSVVSNNNISPYHSGVIPLLTNGGVSSPLTWGHQAVAAYRYAMKPKAIGARLVPPLALSMKADDSSVGSAVPGSSLISAETRTWLNGTIIKSTEFALISACCWPGRVLCASAAMELRGGLPQSVLQSIRKDGYFPKTRQHLIGSASCRHQFTNVFIQLWLNVFTHHSAEELARRHGGLSELEQLLFVAGIAALGAAPGTYSIVKNVNLQHLRPKLKYVVAALFFEWGREAGFNQGCLHVNAVVERHMPEASEVQKKVSVGALSALCGVGTGVFHALACLCYDHRPASNQNPSAPDSMLRFFKTSLPALIKEKPAWKSYFSRGGVFIITVALLETLKIVKGNSNAMSLN